jgi:hypothetical protein
VCREEPDRAHVLLDEILRVPPRDEGQEEHGIDVGDQLGRRARELHERQRRRPVFQGARHLGDVVLDPVAPAHEDGRRPGARGGRGQCGGIHCVGRARIDENRKPTPVAQKIERGRPERRHRATRGWV